MTPNRLCRLRFCAWHKLLVISASTLVLLLFLLSGQPAQAEEPALVPEAPGSISGVVTDAAGVPQGNITVTLLQKSPYTVNEWYSIRAVETNASGAYRIGLLSAGIYRVGFSGPGNRFALNYYNGTPTVQEAQDIVIVGNNVTGINATLATGARITGEISLLNNIVATGGGFPLFGYSDIRAMRKISGRWVTVKQMQFANNPPSSYQLAGLPAGVYRVCINQYYYGQPPYVQPFAECYNDIGSGIDNAADITLALGETKPNINFVLGDNADLAQITGTVKADDGTLLANVNVAALLSQTFAYNAYWNHVIVTQTNAAGVYRLPRLQPGVYTVLFTEARDDYVAEVYADAPIAFDDYNTFANATSFPLQRYEVRSNLNATLTRASHLVGSITLREEGPPANGKIQVYQQRNGEWQIVKQGSADARNGAFHIGGLHAGVYKVTAYASFLYGYPYAGYYGGKNLDEATPISLTLNATRTNINIELTRLTSETIFAGEISGVVTATAGPIKDIQVAVYPGYSCCQAHSPLVYVFTDANGRYRINGLVDGQYYVRFSDPSGTYATIWNNNRRAIQPNQDLVNIYSGAIVTNVNASLVHGGGISGNVRLRNGTPLLDIQVQVYEYRDSYYQYPYLQEIATDVNGNYIIKGLHPGIYQLCFVDQTNKYSQECYGAPPRMSYPGMGIDLTVEAGKTLSGIDQVLGPKLSFYLPIIGR